MTTAPLKAYAGSAACTPCHTEGVRSTAMRRASAHESDAHFLPKPGSASLRLPPFSYSLASTSEGLKYTVSLADRTWSVTPSWVLGAGELGRTFLYDADGHWYQSEVSFYTRPATLDITTGLARSSGRTLPAALGQPLSAEEARACFNCHTVHATTSAGLNPQHAEPGLGCEACHGPARDHVDGMGDPLRAKLASTAFDPAKLSPEDSIDFCGSCHRTSADAKLSVTQAFGSTAIRFQPYRLEESKCWRATKDRRLTCVGCHDPHEPLDRDTRSYDNHCLECHTPAKDPSAAHAGLVCPKADSKCVSCHMPKVPMPSMHGEFTDHYIRVVRAGEVQPR